MLPNERDYSPVRGLNRKPAYTAKEIAQELGVDVRAFACSLGSSPSAPKSVMLRRGVKYFDKAEVLRWYAAFTPKELKRKEYLRQYAKTHPRPSKELA